MQVGEGVFRNHSRWADRYGLVFRADEGPSPGPHELKALKLDDLPALVAADNALTEREFQASAPSDHVRFSIDTNADALRSRILGQGSVTRKVKGLDVDTVGWQIGDPTDPASFACLVAMTVVAEDALVIMRVRAPSPGHMRSLLAAAAAEASRTGLRRCVDVCVASADPLAFDVTAVLTRSS